MDNIKRIDDDPFFYKLKNLWADNGDLISQHYAGTNAATTQITKTGSAGLFNGIFDTAYMGL